jgi:hypothetical protein
MADSTQSKRLWKPVRDQAADSFFLTFYFLQLYALLEAAGQVFLLIVASLYRWRFLNAASRQAPQVASAYA